MRDTDPRLVRAIQAGGVPALGPDTVTIDAALRACRRIAAETEATLTEVGRVLDRNGVGNDPEADLEPRPFHAGEVRIARHDLAPAMAALAAEGFEPPFTPTAARVATIARCRPALRLVRFDGVTTRITLRFDSPAPTRLPDALRPGVADVAMVDLDQGPVAAMAPVLHPLVRVGRLLAERVGFRRSPLAENDFLGTPDGLIEPLLAVADVGPEDVVMDLGCGDGRVLIAAARSLGCRGVGIELNADLARRARAAVVAAGLTDRIEIRHAAAEDTPLAGATVLFAFLPRVLLTELVERCRRDRDPAARILVHEQMALPAGLEPDHSEAVIAENALTVAHLWR